MQWHTPPISSMWALSNNDLHELDIDVDRDVFGLCSAHIVGPTLRP